MKMAASVLVLALGACASQPEGSLERMKRDARHQVVLECLSTPDRFGFPYTRAEHVLVARELPAFAPDLHLYCWQVARVVVH